MNKAIEKARKLLKPIDYEPKDTGYYILVNGDDYSGETYCEDCIDKVLVKEKKWWMEQHRNIIEKYDELAKTGFWEGINIRKRECGGDTDAEFVAKCEEMKLYKLKEYPANPEFEVQDCDPDFGGGATESNCCSECGKYFYTNFVPDWDSAKNLISNLNYAKNGKIPHSFKWELDIALSNYGFAEESAKEVLVKIAKEIIRRLRK